MFRRTGMYGYKQRTQRRTLTMTAAAVLVPLAVACGGEKAGVSVGSQPPVTGIEWTVDSVTVDGTTRRAPASAHVKIDDGKAIGSYGCNQFSATAKVTDDRIRLSNARTTRMACDNTRMAFERALAGTLTAGPLTTRADGRKLTLTTAGGDRVELSRK
ncbi:META domain-containing protein [Streptomyces sp. NPDC056660]|uniref:META domain-containing protein n=1 Tax=Streptomyces sp. NPDC056660 TaxID=3345897 RepID=UPI0036A41807